MMEQKQMSAGGMMGLAIILAIIFTTNTRFSTLDSLVRSYLIVLRWNCCITRKIIQLYPGIHKIVFLFLLA